VPARPTNDWVDKTIAEYMAKNKANHDDTLRGKALAAAWAEMANPAEKAAALEDIRGRWQAKDWWDAPPGKASKQARAIYEAGM
jgi:CRISPR-associated protein Cmr6